MNEDHTQPLIYEALQAQLVEAGVLNTPQSLLNKVHDQLDMYYLPKHSNFHFRNRDGNYDSVLWSAFDTALGVLGVEIPQKGRMEFIETLRVHVVKERTVDVVVQMAGYPSGYSVLRDGTRLLASKGMRMMKPCLGDPKPVLDFLLGLLGGAEGVAYNTLLSWMKIAIEDGLHCAKVGADMAGLRASQLLAIVGPPGCGKTLLVTMLADIFGCITANPYPYFIGNENFNGDLAKTELLVMDDQAESMRSEARHRLTRLIKEYLVVPYRRFNPKNLQAFSAATFQRVIMLSNRDSLGVLPIPERDFLDKYMLFQAHGSEDVSRCRTSEERTAWGARLFGALPALVHYLINEFEIPKDLLDGRYGVAAYQDPELLGELNNEDISQELFRCLHDHYVIAENPVLGGKFHPVEDSTHTASNILYWEGHAKQFQELVEGMPAGQGWKSEFRHRNSAGLLLRSLADNFPEHVKPGTKVRGSKRWRVYFEYPGPKKTGRQSLKEYAESCKSAGSAIKAKRALEEEEKQAA